MPANHFNLASCPENKEALKKLTSMTKEAETAVINSNFTAKASQIDGITMLNDIKGESKYSNPPVQKYPSPIA